MNLLTRIKSALGIGPKRRNVAGGMAWIRGVPAYCGAEIMTGRAVKTVKLDESGLWTIDPPQVWVNTVPVLIDGRSIPRGHTLRTVAIADEYLEPWEDSGLTEREVRELYAAPTVKTRETA